MLRNLLKRPAPPQIEPRIPDGERVYAVGDIHGRLDLLDELLRRIDDDDAAREPAARTLVFLGDLIDRGPHSAQVVQRLLDLKRDAKGIRFLAGNHEEILLLALSGDREATKLFDRIGGVETMKSYGLSHTAITTSEYDELHQLLIDAVPVAHREFLEEFEDMIVIGDYAFVHAGISPSRALDQQRISDLRWIRRQFLEHQGDFGKFVVHGHTITDAVDERVNRLGIDTGAFASGRLTAVGLEGGERWFIQTSPEPEVDA